MKHDSEKNPTRAERALIVMLGAAASHHAGLLAAERTAGHGTRAQSEAIAAEVERMTTAIVLELRQPGPHADAAELGATMAMIAAGAVALVLGERPAAERDAMEMN